MRKMNSVFVKTSAFAGATVDKTADKSPDR